MKELLSWNKTLLFIVAISFGCVATTTQTAERQLSSTLPASPDDMTHELNGEDMIVRTQIPGADIVPADLFSYGNGECGEDMLGYSNTGFRCEDTSDLSNEDTSDLSNEDTSDLSNKIMDEKDQNFLDSALEFYEASQEFWNEGNLEKSIEALDQSFKNILKVSHDNDPELIQQIEDLRFMISKRILEIYASRYTAVNGNHKAIPMTMNKHVEKEIKLFQGVERKFFIESYQRSGMYRDEILKSLRDAGMPEELSWLPLIESGFKVKALSRARALGLWQFIPSTGYKFGLKRNAWIDERLDPDKATAAAIAYMTELHQIFGDWTTVLAAYNCGEGAVLRVIRGQKINYLDNFWDLYQQLPRETARYVPRFLATLHILKDPEKYGFDLEELYRPIPFEIATIEKQVHLKEIAKVIDVSYEDMTALNPELRYKATPKAPYSLKVPQNKADTLLASIDRVPKWSPPKRKYAYHRVRRGETLSTIALKYRTSVRAIARANNIRRTHYIRVGQKLKIPLKKGYKKSYYTASAKLGPDGTYRVRKGDSLWGIAQRFNTSTAEIQRINKLNGTRLYVGQVLKIKNL
jgi:membrane-bound lytic murein transglycosylase D